MAISTLISRVGAYYTRHGFGAAVRRLGLSARRTLFYSRTILFYCDLPTLTSPAPDLPNFLKVEQHTNLADLPPDDRQAITSFWNPKLANRNLQERFGRGASLWLIKSANILAGYGWTLQGCTVEPHYFALAPDDVQFLDFHVFPKYRGRAMDWFLMTHILHRLAAEGRARAFGAAAEWNQASLASFAMTPFRRLGRAKKCTVLGRTLVWWDQKPPVEPKLKPKKQVVRATSGKGAVFPVRRSKTSETSRNQPVTDVQEPTVRCQVDQ
jgi:hypothetical protein